MDFSDAPGVDLSEDVVEEVAKAMVNADNDSFGKAWPWPEANDQSCGNHPWAIEVREDAKRVARVAIRAYEKATSAT